MMPEAGKILEVQICTNHGDFGVAPRASTESSKCHRGPTTAAEYLRRANREQYSLGVAGGIRELSVKAQPPDRIFEGK